MSALATVGLALAIGWVIGVVATGLVDYARHRRKRQSMYRCEIYGLWWRR